MFLFRKKKEIYRTLQMNGSINGETAAEITVDGKVVKSGPLHSGLLFEFITNVQLHGSVEIKIKLYHGGFTITDIRSQYPALINGNVSGFVNFPQPIRQPIAGLTLPLSVTEDLSYQHFMYNGPTQWLIEDHSDQKVIMIDDYYQAAKSGVIRTDWQYKHRTVDIEDLDNIEKHI